MILFQTDTLNFTAISEQNVTNPKSVTVPEIAWSSWYVYVLHTGSQFIRRPLHNDFGDLSSETRI